MALNYIIVGLNHKTAPLSLREKICFSPEDIPQATERLKNLAPIEEGVILSTCNRTEIYAATHEVLGGIDTVKTFLSRERNLKREDFDKSLYAYSDLSAVQHGFRVASSLDSMIVGEPQITGQFKTAYEQAMIHSSTGLWLNRLMQKAIAVAKKVRVDTRISEGSVSVGSAAVELSQKIFGDLKDNGVLILGAGEMAEVVLEHLQKQGINRVTIINRTFEKAKALAEKYKAQARPIEELNDCVDETDMFITSVNSKSPIISAADLATFVKRRKNKTLLMVDLGLPRNIETPPHDLSNLYLFHLDDLKNITDSALEDRKREAGRAEAIVEKEASSFFQSVIHGHETLSSLGKKFEQIRQKEVEKTLKKLAHLPNEERDAVEKMTLSIVNRILHDPMLALKNEDLDERHWDARTLLKIIFKLEE